MSPMSPRVPTSPPRFGGGADLADLAGELFASLPRSDQRRKGELYLRGLLGAEGRKSISNIAACAPDRAAARQSLHHFIASSTWDWAPVRAALAGRAERELGPRAWVVRSMITYKTGTESVGVGRRFVPELGQTVNSQEAYGVWAVGEDRSCPVNWRLLLTEEWRDALRARSPRLAESSLTATPLDCAAGAVEELLGWGTAPVRPVVLALPGAAAGALARRFAAAGAPFVAAVPGSTRARAADPAPAGGGGRELTAHQLLLRAHFSRRPVTWSDPVTSRTYTTLVAAVRVELGPDTPPVLLFGEWTDPRGRPRRCWITDLTGEAPGELLRLAKLARTVDRDVVDVSAGVGLADFAGRSFEGWHRHTTLASAAHLVRVRTLSDRTRSGAVTRRAS